MENDELRRSFIANCISKKRKVRVHLVAGIKLQGVIIEQDRVSIWLERPGFEPQLVNHHGVGTIQPIEEGTKHEGQTDIWWWAIGALLLVIVVLILECQNMAEQIDMLDQKLMPHGTAYPGYRPPED